jgi:hypothetical protein
MFESLNTAHSLNNNSHLKNNQSEPDFRWCFPEPQQASSEDCRLWFRDCPGFPRFYAAPDPRWLGKHSIFPAKIRLKKTLQYFACWCETVGYDLIELLS